MLLLGGVMIVASPFLWRINQETCDTRRDVATVDYFMRSDVWMLLSAGGFALIVSGCIGFWRLRGVRGAFASRKAFAPALPVMTIAVMFGAQFLVVVPFLAVIYDTSTKFKTVALNQSTFIAIKSVVALLACALFVLFGALSGWKLRRLMEPAPQCTECGYSLHGIISERCPECGTTFNEPAKAQGPDSF